jgi:putative photosynthetic complex assembly protein 2
MAEFVLPALYALFLWWFLTGAILYLDGLPRHTFKWTMGAAALVLAGAFIGLYGTAQDNSLFGAYAAFTCGVLIWGWQQISFYTGTITGPRKIPCKDGCSGWRHFGHALLANLYHETSIVACLGLTALILWGAPNQLGLWTVIVLWWMHESARINVFLGVRNLNENFLPEHMAFLKSFLRKKPMNLFFPVSVTVSTALTFWMWQSAAAAAGTAEAAGYSLLAAMMTLAVIEHWFLVLPIPAERLWDWGLKSRKPALHGSHDGGVSPGSGASTIHPYNDNQKTSCQHPEGESGPELEGRQQWTTTRFSKTASASSTPKAVTASSPI